jgi:hypothetical protein
MDDDATVAKRRMMIYLAGPVFTLAERRFNEELAGELERLCPSLQVFLPQRYDKEFQDAPIFPEDVCMPDGGTRQLRGRRRHPGRTGCRLGHEL